MIQKIQNSHPAMLLLVACLLAIVTSCSKQGEYTDAIPTTATELISVNLKALAQKAGLNEAENQTTLNKLTETLKNGLGADMQQQVESFMSNPDHAGIDFSAPVYLFYASQPALQGLVAKVSNRDKLENFLQATQKEELLAGLQTADDYSFTYSEELFIAFNATTLLAIGTQSSMDIGQMCNNATQLLAQSRENSVRSQPYFAQLQEQNGDIQVLFSFESLKKLYAQYPIQQLPSHIDLNDLKFIANLAFENGRITLQGTTYTDNEALKALLEKQNQASHPTNGRFIPYFPQNTLMWMNWGIDGEKLYELLQADETLQSQIPTEENEFLKSTLSAFRNDITVGITGITMSGNPSFLAYAETSDPNLLTSLYQQSEEMNLNSYFRWSPLNENDYLLKAGTQSVYLGMRGNDLFITNDKAQYDRIGQEASPSIQACDYMADVTGQPIAVILNTEALFGLPIVKLAMGFLSPTYRAYLSAAENITYIGITGQQQTGNLFLQLKDKNTNALKQLVDLAKEFAGM